MARAKTVKQCETEVAVAQTKEVDYEMEVAGLYVLATKLKRVFKILEKENSKVQKILDMNKVI